MSEKSALGERVIFPSPYLDKFIAIHQTHSHVPRERSPPGDTPCPFSESDTVSPELPDSRRHGQDRAWGQ